MRIYRFLLFECLYISGYVFKEYNLIKEIVEKVEIVYDVF